jgi:membrane fusion protein, heavy metal efflux system
MIRAALLASLGVLLACGEPAAPAPTAPAAVHPREQDLGIVELDPDALVHLGIERGEISAQPSPRTRRVAGTVVVPPGAALTVAAPVAGSLRAGDRPLRVGAEVERGDVLLRLVPLAPVDRDLRAQSRRQSDASKARLAVARARLERTRKLLEQRGASQRALEEAQGELDTAIAEDAAASARERMLKRSPLDADAVLPLGAPQPGIVRTIGAAIGQSVAAGTVLFEVVDTHGLWVRTPVLPSELDQLDATAPVRIARLGARSGDGDLASAVAAPPSADPTSATVDVFYALDAAAARFRPGERVQVELVYDEPSASASVPASAVVRDFDGGAWVYACVDEHRFRRARIEVLRQHEGRAVIGRGPAVGTCVVTVGALELLGIELGVAH